MRNIYRLLTIIITLFLISCGSALPKVKPFKMDIQQGNVVTSEMLLKLRPGMTKSQVKFIMGTPLLVDSFRTNRWDYFYQLRKQGKIVKQHRVILDFENDLLKRVRGDVVPKGQTVDDVTKKLEEEAKQEQIETAPVEREVQEPTVVPIESPEAKVTDQMMPPEGVAETPQSVLAVPLSVEPEQTVEAVQPIVAPDAQTDQPELDKPEVNQLEQQVEENAEVVAPTPESAPAAEQLQSQENQLQPNRDKRVFRLDRQLDTSRIKPTEASEASAGSAVKEVVETVEDPLLEEDPSFFERMLEKIGF